MFAVIDSIEDGKAVLLVGEEEKKAVFPADELPTELNEGDYVDIAITYDGERTQAARDEAEALLKELDGE